MSNTLKFGAGKWAAKEGSVLAYNDENNNFKPLPFTFTRASSATRVNESGLIESVASGVPRIDFLDNADGHLLLEPSRTNSLPYSTLAFNGDVKPTGWTVGFATGTYSHEEVTYKGQGAVKHTQITEGRSYLDSGSLTLVNGVTYILTVKFDLENCSVDYSSEPVLSTNGFSSNTVKTFSDIDENGVLSFQFTTGADSIGNIRIGLGNQGNAAGGQFLTFSMPQVEAGSYATSYIPTSGSSVTRVADDAANGGNSQVFDNDSAVWFVDCERIGIEGGGAISLQNGSGVEQIRYHFDAPTEFCRFRDVLSGSVTIGGLIPFTDSVRKKFALRIDGSTLSVFTDGEKFGSDYTRPTAFDIQKIQIYARAFYLYDMKFYNTALSDSELIALTS